MLVNCACDRTQDLHNEGRVHFGSRFEGISPSWREGERETAGNRASAVRKERVGMKAGAQLVLAWNIQSKFPVPERVLPSNKVFTPWLAFFLETSSQTR